MMWLAVVLLAAADGSEQHIELGRLVGKGYWAEIHAGTNRATGQEVAVKRLRPARRGRGGDTLDKEAALLAAAKHPNLPTVYGVGRVRDSDERALVMEYVHGAPLGDPRRPGRARPPAEAVRIAREVLGAVEELHRLGFRHNDIHPGNIVVGERDGAVKLLDPGNATPIDADHKSAPTPYYAPEQRRGSRRRARGVSADLYSVGAVLAYCLTGRHPTGMAIINEIADPRLRAVVRRAMDHEPARRHQSAAELLADLPG